MVSLSPRRRAVADASRSGDRATTSRSQDRAITDGSCGLSTNASVGTPIVQTYNDVQASLTINNASANTFGGVLKDGTGVTAALSLIKGSAGTLTLSGSNTYSGATTVNQGTLLGGAADTFSSASAVNIVNGTTFNLGGFDQSIGSLTGTGNVTTSGAGGLDTLTVGNDNTSPASFAGVISNASTGRTLALTKVGTGTLTLGGNNTFTGGVTIDAGTLQLGSASALNSATPNAVTFSSNAILSLAGNSVTVSALNQAQTTSTFPAVVQNGSATPATLTVNGGGDYYGTLTDGSGGGALSLVKNGSGALLLNGISLSGSVTMNAGALFFSAYNSFRGATINGGSLYADFDQVANVAAVSFGAGSTGSLNLNSADGSALLPSPQAIIGSLTTNANVGRYNQMLWMGS
jgi:autotransporter-associated beta strand protein